MIERVSKTVQKSATWKILSMAKLRSWLKVFKSFASHKLKTWLRKKSWRKANNVSKSLFNFLKISRKNGLRAINFLLISMILWQQFRHQRLCSNQDNIKWIFCSNSNSHWPKRHSIYRQNHRVIWKTAVWSLELQPQENRFDLSKVS